jgi:hypothetical protein
MLSVRGGTRLQVVASTAGMDCVGWRWSIPRRGSGAVLRASRAGVSRERGTDRAAGVAARSVTVTYRHDDQHARSAPVSDFVDPVAPGKVGPVVWRAELPRVPSEGARRRCWVSCPGCGSAGRREGPHDAPACGTDYGDDAVFANLSEIPTDYAHAKSAGHSDRRAMHRMCKSGRSLRKRGYQRLK